MNQTEALIILYLPTSSARAENNEVITDLSKQTLASVIVGNVLCNLDEGLNRVVSVLIVIFIPIFSSKTCSCLIPFYSEC